MKTRQFWILLAGAAWVAAHAAPAAAQDPAARKPPGQSQAVEQKRAVYQTYQPSKRLRSRRDTCVKDETLAGAWCVKACMKTYVFVPGSNPPKCRTEQPLPAGQIPRAEWQESTPPLPKRAADPEDKAKRVKGPANW